MDTLKQIPILLQKEFVLDWRSKYALGGILLYVFSTVFIIYNGFIRIENMRTWNVIFWITTLFTSVNAITKSFVNENSNRQLYYYTIADPIAVIFSKIIYNSLLLIILNLVTYAIYSLVIGNPIRDVGLFMLTIFLGSLGLSITLTFISAIANKAKNSATLMAILSFPILIPIFVSLIKISNSALGLITDTSVWKDIVALLAIDAILLGLTFILFPFLWKD